MRKMSAPWQMSQIKDRLQNGKSKSGTERTPSEGTGSIDKWGRCTFEDEQIHTGRGSIWDIEGRLRISPFYDERKDEHRNAILPSCLAFNIEKLCNREKKEEPVLICSSGTPRNRFFTGWYCLNFEGFPHPLFVIPFFACFRLFFFWGRYSSLLVIWGAGSFFWEKQPLF